MDRADRLAADGYAGIEPVLFYRPSDDYGVFSNFAAIPVVLPHPFTQVPTTYATGEHRYQAMKGGTAQAHDWVAGLVDEAGRPLAHPDTAFAAKQRGGPRGVVLRPDWGNDYGDFCWYAMLEVVLAKTANAKVRWWLKKSGDRPIYEDSPTDDIWGWRYRNDHRGKNLLGRCLMAARVPLTS